VAHEMGHGHFLQWSHSFSGDSEANLMQNLNDKKNGGIDFGMDTPEARSEFSFTSQHLQIFAIMCKIATQKFEVDSSVPDIILPRVEVPGDPGFGGDFDSCPNGDCGRGSGWCIGCGRPELKRRP
jgi:hypothetical protein